MTQSQIDQYNMLLAVDNHFNDSPGTWNTNVPITQVKGELSGLLSKIATQHAKQLTNTTGVTEAKNNTRKQLEESAFQISAALSAYASMNSLTELLRAHSYTITDLNRFQDAELVGICENLYRGTSNELANLSDFGITQPILDDFENLRIQFVDVMKDGDKARARTKDGTENLAKLLPEALDLLRTKLDLLMVGFAATAPEFAGMYQTLRQILDSPTNPHSLTTLCLDSATELPIEDVTLRIEALDIERRSGKSGFNTYQNIGEGDHIITASHPGYISQSIPFVVVGSQTTELAILLVRK